MGLPARAAAIPADSRSLSRAGADRPARDRHRQGPRAAHQGAFRRLLGLGVGRLAGRLLPGRAADRVLRPDGGGRAPGRSGAPDAGADRHAAAGHGGDASLSHGGAHRHRGRRLRTGVSGRRLARPSRGPAPARRGGLDPLGRQQIPLSRLRQHRRGRHAVDGLLSAGLGRRARPWRRRSRGGAPRHRPRRRGHTARHGLRARRRRGDARRARRRCELSTRSKRSQPR